MTKKKSPIWIYALILIGASAIIYFLFLSPEKVSCGDGICSEKETEFCVYDCEQQCRTGAIEPTREVCSTGWQTAYLLQMEAEGVSKEYLKETPQIDFSNGRIQQIAQTLKKDTAKETTKATLKWTYDNIRYDGTNTYYDCLGDKSSEIVERGYGLCSTMTKVNLALLRANGIASYPVTGCWNARASCNIIQTFFQQRLPEIFPLEADSSGFYPLKGGLHNYLLIYLPNEGWLRGESTAGLLFEEGCINYLDFKENPTDALNCGLNPRDNEQEQFIEECRAY